MNTKLNQKKTYRVTMARPVFQVTMVDVEAEREEEAAELAFEQAAKLSDEAWTGEFDAEHYSPHVVSVLEEQLASEWPSAEDPMAYRRYLILLADTMAGEGSVLLQRWLWSVSSLMICDLWQDWSGPLEELAAQEGEEFQEWLLHRNEGFSVFDILPSLRRPNSPK